MKKDRKDSPTEPPPNLPAPWNRPDPHTRAASVRQTVRRAEPSERLADTLELVDRLSNLSDSRDQVFRTIEQLTGLRLGELQALEAVDEGADHPREVARRTGQTAAAATATCDGLIKKGLLGRHRHESAPFGEPGLIHATTAGEVVLGQVEGLQVRLTDSVLGSLDEEEAERLHTAVVRAGRRLAVAGTSRSPNAGLIAGA
ncbi:MAG: MarR family transcriptional regulator [Georgenia sp.]